MKREELVELLCEVVHSSYASVNHPTKAADARQNKALQSLVKRIGHVLDEGEEKLTRAELEKIAG